MPIVPPRVEGLHRAGGGEEAIGGTREGNWKTTTRSPQRISRTQRTSQQQSRDASHQTQWR